MAMCGLSVNAQSWTAPTIQGEDPVDGVTYKIYNVGAEKYLTGGQSWFGWNTTAILANSGSDFTYAGNDASFTLTTHRSGNAKFFTSGNNIPGDAMHVDGQSPTNYGLTKLASGYYHIHDAGGNESSPCWGYGIPSGQNVAGVVAHADASSVDWKCEWLFVGPLYNSRVNLYNLLLTAYGEGVNTDDASDVYNNASATLEQLNTAYNNLNQARYQKALASASNNNPKDITEWVLTNPDFSTGNINGWETNYVSGQQAQNIGYQGATYTNGNVTISQFIEAWRPGATLGDGYLRQTVSGLPEGKYVLEADGISVWQNDQSRTVTGSQIYITADGVDYFTNMSTANDKPEHFSVQFLNTGEGDVIFGLRTISSNGNWLCADNFKVTFYGIDLSAYATQLATEVTTFEGYKNSIDATVYASLQTQVDALSKATYNSSKTYATAIAHMQAINSYVVALIAANDVDQTTKMNATALQTLQGAIAASVDASDVDALETAISSLTTATTNATTSIANYAEAKAILDAANGYDASGQASYAADETIVAIQAAYDNGTLEAVTNEQKAAAQAALATACKDQTQPADGCDMTAYIVNPNFDSNANGWTTEKNGSGWSAEPYNGNNHNIEYWSPSVIDENVSTRFFDYYQTITGLPNGAYTISASMLNSTNGEENEEGHDAVDWNGGGNAGVYGKTANDEQIALITINDQTFRTYTTGEILVVDGELRIGVKNINPLTGRWFAADNFKLTYVRQLKAEEEEAIAKAIAVKAYNDAFAAAQAISEGSVPAPFYTNLQNVISENTLEDGTSSEYNAAATALSEAAAEAQSIVVSYTAWKALKAYADALVAVDNDNNNANSTLATAISDQKDDAEAATTAAAIATATSTLKSAMITYAGVANPVGDNAKFDLTFMLTNPNLEGLPTWTGAEGWHTEQTGGNSQVMTNGYATSEDNTKTAFYEYWKNPPTQDNVFALYQEVTLTEGTYNMSCYAFAQYEQEGKHENIPNGVYFYANDVQGSAVNNARLSEQSIEFVNPSEQEVKIGLKPVNGNGNTWMGIGYVKLYKVPAKTFDISEDAEYDKTQEGAGTVTLKRTIKVGFNTLVLPFSMTQAEVEDVFGKDSKVYVVSSYDEDKKNISFDINDGINANKPCLLKATEASNGDYTLENRTIVAGEPVANGDKVSMTGTYKTIYVPVGNYIISGDMIYEVDGQSQVSLKGTRAYITIKSGSEARTLTMSFDDTATGIATIKDGKLELETGDIYDLSGRKVKNPTKGIYLMNGKKVIK